MIKKKVMWLFIVALTVSVACDPSSVENEPAGEQTSDEAVANDSNKLDAQQTVADEKKLDNGIVIKWFEHGEGEQLAAGDCASIDYKVQLEDGTVVDGNHLLKKESIPFIIGFGLQTEGWDIALQELKVGDFAEIFIPSALARGEKGIKDLIPPNADNVVRIRILEKQKPTREIDGNKVWVFEENTGNTILFNENNEIDFHCMVSTPSTSRYINTYWDNNPFKLRLNDGGTVPGLKKALINAKKSDRMFVLVPAEQAYGTQGYQDIVKPNEDLLYNIFVMNVTTK